MNVDEEVINESIGHMRKRDKDTQLTGGCLLYFAWFFVFRLDVRDYIETETYMNYKRT